MRAGKIADARVDKQVHLLHFLYPLCFLYFLNFHHVYLLGSVEAPPEGFLTSLS